MNLRQARLWCQSPIAVLLAITATSPLWGQQAVALSSTSRRQQSTYDGASRFSFEDTEPGIFSSEFDRHCKIKINDACDEVSTAASARPASETQMKSICSDAPAILLKSGPGTGKTYALASRIAHLIRIGSCRPEQMVVLSFTNRDAQLLRQRSLEILSATDTLNVSKTEISSRLWSGTIHAFASSIIRAHSRSTNKLRVLTSNEMRSRVDRCLHTILNVKHYATERGLTKLKKIRIVHRDALSDLRQSRGMVLHQISRCIEVWKEARLIHPPSVVSLHKTDTGSWPTGRSLRDQCLEISMRLGISQNVAILAFCIIPEYQTLHSVHETADPSDLASIAYCSFTTNTPVLDQFREKLKHIIVDEYQDVSVAQHALIRLIIRGEDTMSGPGSRTLGGMKDAPPVLESERPFTRGGVGMNCFNVPNLFCCGDSNQSIYGWRGAAPSLTVDNFREDYPQGIVVSLDTCFRLSQRTWDATNSLIGAPIRESQATRPSALGSHDRLGYSCAAEYDDISTLPMLFSSESCDLDTPIRIEGLWDAREEAKVIAWAIRKRSKCRMKRMSTALRDVGDATRTPLVDPTEVAIMVRSSKLLALVEEALVGVGIPFLVCQSDTSPINSSQTARSGNIKLLDMTPVLLMTMHRAKGEEYDDVYLAGWTEGVFPHPTSVSMNRIHEERRLAYVALTRARSQTMITHSFTRRVPHGGPELTTKYVTEQVRPSRFLYELLPSAKDSIATVVCNTCSATKFVDRKPVPSIIWTRGRGIKEHVAGRSLPDYFAKSYVTPPGFVSAESAESHHPDGVGNDMPTQYYQKEERLDDGRSPYHLLLSDTDKATVDTIECAFREIREKQRGAKTTYRALFRKMLRERFDLERGTVVVLESPDLVVDELALAPGEVQKTKPLSQSTAIELGQYLYYLIVSSRKVRANKRTTC